MAVTGYSIPTAFGLPNFHGTLSDNEDSCRARNQYPRYPTFPAPVGFHNSPQLLPSHSSSTLTSPRHSPPHRTLSPPSPVYPTNQHVSINPQGHFQPRFRAEYLRDNCLLISHIGDNIEAELESHFARSLSSGSPSSCAFSGLRSAKWPNKTPCGSQGFPEEPACRVEPTASDYNVKDFSYNLFYPGSHMWSAPYMTCPQLTTNLKTNKRTSTVLHNNYPTSDRQVGHEEASYCPNNSIQSSSTRYSSPYTQYKIKKDYNSIFPVTCDRSNVEDSSPASILGENCTKSSDRSIQCPNAIKKMTPQHDSLSSGCYGNYGGIPAGTSAVHYNNPWSVAAAAFYSSRQGHVYPLSAFGTHQQSPY